MTEASHAPTALLIARRLLAKEAAPGKEGDAAMVGANLQRACLRVTESLRDAMGEDGYTALLARALARTEDDHPALKNIRRLSSRGIRLDNVVAGIETHGVGPVTAAIEAMLAALIEVLGRLIGEDMALRIIDQETSGPRTGDMAQGHP
jgi:hypothetical protein